jgi:hypothetical protein
MIKIINNFFDDKTYDKIINHIKTKIYFTPRFWEGRDKTKENYYGDRFVLNSDKNLLNTFVTQSEKKFNIKIKKIHHDCGIDLRNMDDWVPHIDEGYKINILVMLEGPIGVTTGTVFYTDNDLDIHIGFRPNRAILFPSLYLHSPHKCKLEGMRRYTASLFIKEYEGN